MLILAGSGEGASIEQVSKAIYSLARFKAGHGRYSTSRPGSYSRC